MSILFNEDKLLLPVDFEINSLILEQASDTAEKLTELECKLNGIKCYVSQMESEDEILTYTEEAQDIYNEYYDSQISELYALLNTQLLTIETLTK